MCTGWIGTHYLFVFIIHMQVLGDTASQFPFTICNLHFQSPTHIFSSYYYY